MKNLKQTRRVLLTLFTVGFVTLFSIGCGSSGRDAFVATGGSPPAAPTGNLVFQFQRAAAQTINIVPADTSTLRVDLYSTDPPASATLVFTATFPFQDVLVVEDVSTDVQSAVVTAFNEDGLPVARYTASVDVQAGVDTEVDLGEGQEVPFEAVNVSPDPVNLLFTNPEVEDRLTLNQQLSLTGLFGGNVFFLPINDDASFTTANSLVANVSSDGLVSARFFPGNVLGGNTTVTATYDFMGTEQQGTVDVFTRIFVVFPLDPTTLTPGETYNSGFEPVFVDADGQQVDIDDAITFSLENSVEGVTVNSETGVVTTTSSTPIGDFNVLVTWVDGRNGGTGLTFVCPVEFSIEQES